jgi:hypothetical protein
MDELLASLLSAAVLVFAVASMLSVGLAYSIREILGPLRSVRRVALVLVANFVLVPTWALLLTWVFGLAEPYAIGLVVVACAAGAPFLVKLVTTADGDVAIAASLLILLLPVTVVYMPLVVPLIAPDADVSAGAIATPLVLTNLLPLAVGMVVLARLPKVAERLRPPPRTSVDRRPRGTPGAHRRRVLGPDHGCLRRMGDPRHDPPRGRRLRDRVRAGRLGPPQGRDWVGHRSAERRGRHRRRHHGHWPSRHGRHRRRRLDRLDGPALPLGVAAEQVVRAVGACRTENDMRGRR